MNCFANIKFRNTYFCFIHQGQGLHTKNCLHTQSIDLVLFAIGAIVNRGFDEYLGQFDIR